MCRKRELAHVQEEFTGAGGVPATCNQPQYVPHKKKTKSTSEEHEIERGGPELWEAMMGRKLTALRNSPAEVSAGRQSMDLPTFQTGTALCRCCEMQHGFLREVCLF